MSDGERTPRQSSQSQFWVLETEKLAVRVNAYAIELLTDGRGDAAGEAHCLAEDLRRLAGLATAWAFLERDNEARVEQMNDLISAHRKAFEMLSRGC